MAAIVTNKANGSTAKGFRLLWKYSIKAVKFTYLKKQTTLNIKTMKGTRGSIMVNHTEIYTFPSANQSTNDSIPARHEDTSATQKPSLSSVSLCFRVLFNLYF
jgi:hypothetical protein